jgi:Tfp pilus assembly protein PilX
MKKSSYQKGFTHRSTNEGFTLFVAVIIVATLLLVATGIASISVKENFLTSASRESQYAFYAADTGAECAIYWDVKNTTGLSAFATSTSSTISCNHDSSNNFNPVNTLGDSHFAIVGGSSVSTFTLTFLPDPYCATVTVTKASDNTTKIESAGYNTCDTTNPRRVERAVRVSY